MDADEIRAEFIAAQSIIWAVTDGETLAFDPHLDIQRVLQLATWLLDLWPQETPYDWALHQLASATSALFIDPSPATLDSWRKARADHADALTA